MKIFHWVIPGAIVITAIIDWAFYIHQMLADKARSLGLSTEAMVDIENHLFEMELATSIIRWLSSGNLLLDYLSEYRNQDPIKDKGEYTQISSCFRAFR
jgi:hypothetical protein